MIPQLPVQTAITANLVVIRQGIGLLGDLGAERFTPCIPRCYNASAGGHTRHIIEHYQSFLRGLEAGEIDYENRPRDALVESDAAYASGLLEGICIQLAELDGKLSNRGLLLCAETTPGIAGRTGRVNATRRTIRRSSSAR